MSVALWKRLNVTKQQLKQKLHDMYYKSNLSQSKIAEALSCDTTCIENWFKRFEIDTRTPSQYNRNTRRRKISIPQDEKHIFDGLMLSDLHIESGTFQARASFGFKHKEFANYVTSNTPSLRWNKITYNKVSNSWHAKTVYSTTLFKLHESWYQDRIKIVPVSIKMSPEVLLWWYMGDGYKTKYGAVLCTDSFTKKENEHLSSLIRSVGIPCHVAPRNRIRIKGNPGFDKFINYIGPPPVECYRYKWGAKG